MALVVVASDKGSPGVSTTALTLAAVWPRRALLAELDPSGGDVALRLRGPRGAPLSPEVGLISLAVAVRRGTQPQQVFEHVQRLDGGLEVVVGLATGEQGSGLTGLWEPVGQLLDEVPGLDVIADCGRLYAGSPATDVLQHASAVLLVTRPSIEAVAHLRARAAAVLRDLDRRPTAPPPVSVAVVTSPRDDASPRQIELVLRQAGLPVPVLGRIALDPKGAGLLAGEWVGRLDRSLLVRSAREVAGRLAQQLAAPVGEVTAVDHAVVRRLRTEVADQIAGQRRDDAVLGLTMSAEDERQYARSLIARALAQHARVELESARVPPTAEEEEALAAAVHAALYGVGRLQPLLDDPMVENVDINGCDRVFVGYADGRELMLDPVAETDEELVELVQTLAAYSGLSSRPFDTANPQLDLRLPDGSRLSAVMEVCRRPMVSIRRARLPKVFLSDLVGNGTLDEGMAAFLRAAVRARKNVMIAGSTNAGKTTLLRALANEIPAHERLITVERALELGLDEFPDLHPNVVAFEERLPNSEGQGRISMAELVRRSLRMNPSRVIVGEVLGDEIVTMLNAMSQGNDGSLSTIHANSSSEVFNRIATYALQATERLPIEASHMLIAGAINFVVFIQRRNDYREGGDLRRFVSSIREVNGVDGRVVSSEIWAAGRDGRARPAASIQCVADLEAVGYRPDDYGRWAG